ncbi:MAG: hypothetical protein NXI04_18075 [Planctomycetaceae bacterium]|nr:hypothetical protein [Planctomycetaceae bacterium]
MNQGELKVNTSVKNTGLVVVVLLGVSLAAAQEEPEKAERTDRTFLLQTVAQPADPDPTTQTKQQRTATLRQRMQEVRQLLQDGKVEQCLNEYVDPFWLARAAASSGWTVDELLDRQILADKQRAQGLADAFLQTLRANREVEPTWLLKGRVASFIRGGSSRTAEFWIYYEGKWRISPKS